MDHAMTNVTMKLEQSHPQTDAAVSGLPPAGSHQLAWRTRSISSSARASSEGGMSRDSAPGRLSIDDKLELGRLLDRPSLAFIEGATPRDEIECALIIQMACTHSAAMAVQQ
jgi:hypothetical protein